MRGVAAAAVYLCFSFAIATAATPLTLHDSVVYALSHNAAIAAKKSAVASAQATFTKQRAQELPPVTGTLQNQLARSSNAGGQFAQFGIAPSNKFSQNTAQIGTQYTLYNGSLTQIAAQEGKRQLESARADLKQTEEQVTTNVVSAYFGVASKENGSLIARNNLAYQQTLLSAARAKERAGLVAGVDVLRADAAVQQALSTNLVAQSDAQTARETLAQSIGAPIETPFTVSQTVPEPALPAQTVENLSRIALANRPDIAVAQANLAVAKLSRAAIDTDLRPQITLNGAFGNQLSPTNAASQAAQINSINSQCAAGLLPPSQCAGAPFTFNRGTPGFWQIGATTTLGVPLIDYGTRKTAHAAGDENIRSAQLALDTTMYGAQADVHQSLRGAQTAAASLVYQKKAAALAGESARIAQLQYKNGLISLTDVTAAQNTAVSAQTDLFNARVAYVNALVKLRTALGTFDPAGIVSDL
ncbi:MAG: TolC family protein [Candidatus Eremiobacteraeota bacterium]|nr:TolC family protein [Candidatus Eremiobacteraeota bacterium]